MSGGGVDFVGRLLRIDPEGPPGGHDNLGLRSQLCGYSKQNPSELAGTDLYQAKHESLKEGGQVASHVHHEMNENC